MIEAFAPGRVNLIGEHTDYSGGLVLPMALEMGITVSGSRVSDRIRLTSDQQEEPLDLCLPVGVDLAEIEPAWGRFVAGVAREFEHAGGFDGTIVSSLPAGGSGLSSSSALTCAALLAIRGLAIKESAIEGGGERRQLAEMARRIEREATGVHGGIMDQMVSMCGVADHGLLIDCHSLETKTIAIPEGLEVLVFHSGQPRLLADSAYNQRRQSCVAIEQLIGPLRLAGVSDLSQIKDPLLARRARHVVTENERVRAMVDAFAGNDLALAGQILTEGHQSLACDYEVSTAIVDAQAARVEQTPGVFGARLTGGGFGGSLVAFCEPGVVLDIEQWWIRARPGPGAWMKLE